MDNLLLKPKPKPTISLTALIDVVFILLLFFMLTSSFTQWTAVDFHSPVASSDATAKKPQLIKLNTEGYLSIYGQSEHLLTDESINTAIDTHLPTVVLPEAEVDLQLIISTFEHLKSLGINKLSLGSALPKKTNQM